MLYLDPENLPGGSGKMRCGGRGPRSWNFVSTHSRCPACDAPVEHPRGSPDPVGRGTHTSRDCPRCGAPLIFYSQSGYIERWELDDRERRSRERSNRYDG
jgi:endogenous inhibitor of DNA gyrase (YacG/DUF329 family)